MENKPKFEIENGTKYWHLNDQFHREDGPAIEMANGTKKWYINGQFHRLDGPAVELFSGTKKWWVNGFHVTDEITQWATNNNIDLDNLSEVDKALIKLIWADYGK